MVLNLHLGKMFYYISLKKLPTDDVTLYVQIPFYLFIFSCNKWNQHPDVAMEIKREGSGKPDGNWETNEILTALELT